MAIKFEEKGRDAPGQRQDKAPKAKVSPSEEAVVSGNEGASGELPFGKPVRPEKKGRRK